MSKKNQTYIVPEVEILEIEVEQGFAVSTEDLNWNNGEKPW